MKKLITGLLLAVILPLGLQAKTMYEAEKNAQKTFAASEKNTLVIENKYGNVNITAWDKNEVDIKVSIVGTSSASQADAEKQRDRVTIAFSESGSNLIAITTIAEKIGVSSNSSSGFEINYEVKVPKNIAFNLANKYGNIIVDECGGATAIDVKYGNLTCLQLKHPGATLTLGYGKANIQKINGLKAEVKYSSMTLGEINQLTLDSKYSDLNIDKAGTLDIVSKYDEFSIKELNELKIDAKYTDIKMGAVSKRLSIQCGFGGVKVANVVSGAESLTFDLSYTDLLLNINPKISYDLTASTSYGKTTLASQLKPSSNVAQETDKKTTTLRGTVGSGTPTLKVKISNKYADNKLTAN